MTLDFFMLWTEFLALAEAVRFIFCVGNWCFLSPPMIPGWAFFHFKLKPKFYMFCFVHVEIKRWVQTSKPCKFANKFEKTMEY